MPHPKLSAILNNCPLHALTPEIKSEVIKYSADEHYDNVHNAQYIALKNLFAAFYELNPETFSWEHFANLLKNYNAFDTQIILGPVLRLYMKEAMVHEEIVPILAIAQDITPEEYIQSKTELNLNTNRYESLSPDELFTYVSKTLGFSLTYHPQEEPSITFELPLPISEIEIYHQGGIDGAHAGGHWERTNKGESSVNVQNQDDTQLHTIIQLLGESSALNPYGFDLLKKHVQIRAGTIETGLQSERVTAELDIIALQILKYISNINSVPKTLAVSLLGQDLSPVTRQFIKEYEFEAVPRNQIFERWIMANEGKKPYLNVSEQKVIDVLITPAPQSQNSDVLKREIALPVNLKTTHAQLKFQVQLELLNDKMDDLALRREKHRDNPEQFETFNKAWEAADSLHTKLAEAGAIYFNNPNPRTYQTFENTCNTLIDKAHTVLDKHRSWSEFLVNLAIGIFTAGAGLLIKGVINAAMNRSFFYVHQTKSSELLDEIKSDIKNSAPSA